MPNNPTFGQLIKAVLDAVATTPPPPSRTTPPPPPPPPPPRRQSDEDRRNQRIIDSLRNDLRQRGERIGRLEAENAGLRARNDILTGENERLSSENDDLSAKLAAYEARKGLMGEDHAKDEELRALRTLVTDLQAQQEADVDNIANLRSRIESLEARQMPIGGAHEPIGPLPRTDDDSIKEEWDGEAESGPRMRFNPREEGRI